MPRGHSSHLNPAHTVKSKSPEDSGSQPVACVVSTSVRAPWRRAAARIAARSATRPSTDCTADTATSVVPGPISPASAVSSTARSRTPSRCANGVTSELNSWCGYSTSEPGGSEAAITAVCTATAEPIATRPGATPATRANAARAASTWAKYASVSIRPSPIAVTAARRAAVARAGSRPCAAVLRYAVSGANSPGARGSTTAPHLRARRRHGFAASVAPPLSPIPIRRRRRRG